MKPSWKAALRSRSKAVVWALWPLLLLTPPLIWLGKSYSDQLASEERVRTQRTLELHAGAVQRSVDRVEGKLESLAVFVAGQTPGGKAVDEGTFSTFAAGLLASANWIRAFQIVSDGIITHTYPLKGNEAVLGYNLLTDPRPVIGGDVLRAQQTGRVTITGPLDLVQGGLGIIIRRPLPRTKDAPVRLVAIVLNIAPLLAESGFREDGTDDILIAIRRAPGDVFFGSRAVFEHEPVTRRISLPDGSWEMGGSPSGGWQASAGGPVLRFHLVGAAMILLLCLLVYVLAHSRANLVETVRERTEALRDELAARQQAQEQLRQNFALLEAVSEGTSDAVFAKDRGGRYQMINSAGAGFLGTTPEAIIGRNDLELFSVETGGLIMAQDRQVMESGQVRTFEDRATAAGITRTYQATKAPWRDKSGNVVGVVGVSRDITEGKRIEEALRKSESQLTLILNNVSDIIFAVAVEAGGGFRFTAANRRFLEATGLQEHQVVGARARDVIPAPAQEVVFQKYHEAIQSGLPVRWEEASEYPAGRKVGHVTVVPVFDSHGTCTQLVGMVHDITERLQAEDEVRRLNEDLRRHAEILEQRVAERTAELAVARDRAETADRLKSAFLATMSHELRTPLNSIIGFTGILLQGLAGPLNPEQGKQLEMVRGSARHLLALINDVLDISKIEAGQLAVNRERVQLRASIDKVAGIVKPLAEKKGLDLRVALAPEIGTVVSDTRRIEQVLLNLLNNAVKFTERGEVTLRVWAEAGRTGQAEKLASGVAAGRPLTATDTVVRFQVSDTGIGVKPEELATLFQPFRQIDTGLTRQHEGTGLGLVICRRLAELMGGAISVQSEWGKGSVFTFTLPASGKR